ncbi:MAG: Fic family protein [Verrucomicrobiales bacterium]|jgi:Fic family protein|nr:Fic family protein [Verrucomicrobiales bacterium]
MNRGLAGYYVPISSVMEKCNTFVPNNLPPNPAILFDEELNELLILASSAVGRLDGLTLLLPEPEIFLYTYVRKEAVLSSQIEGTQSTLSDLLLFESDAAPGVPVEDAREVSNYVSALNFGLERMRAGLPISLRLLREIHGVLLAKGRGGDKNPGEFRSSQNWLGGNRPGNARFVPPPPELLLDCLGALEKFLHDDPVRTSPLVKAALSHVQFETIHPFLDGNGRLGRLLIPLLLCAEGELSQPLLYLSLYFKQHRNDYYRLLQKVRLTGDWEAWLKFFLRGVKEIAGQAVDTARRLLRLFAEDRAKIQRLGRAAGSAYRIHQLLQSAPVCSAARLAEKTGLTSMTCRTVIRQLEKLGIVSAMTGEKYGQLFAYREYLQILNRED